MTTNNENLGMIVSIDDEHTAQEMIPSIEAAGLEECESLDIANIVLGKIAMANLEQTIENVRQIPGVLAIEEEMTFGPSDQND